MGVRSTALIPDGDNSVRVFNRIGEARGVAGAWQESEPTWLADEKIVGKPETVPITVSDYNVLSLRDSNGNGTTPTVLLQKLGRQLKGQYGPGSDNVEPIYETIRAKSHTAPHELPQHIANLANAMVAVATPTPASQQVIEEVIVEPTAQAIAYAAPLIQEEVSHLTIIPDTQRTDAVLTIPEPEQYVGRIIHGKTEQELYDYARAEQQNVLLTGEAGTGKTSSARNYAATHRLPFVTIECTQQIDQSVTQGRFVPTGKGSEAIWRYSQLATAIQQPSVILINELSRMSPKAASLFLRLLQERQLVIEPMNQVIKVHPDVLFIADQNMGYGYNGAQKQDAALVDRFNVKVEFTYDTEIEKKFIPSPTLLEFATAIRSASELNDEFSVPMSTRILQNFVRQAKALGMKFAVESMLNNYPKSDGERDAIKMRLDVAVDDIANELGATN
jgi:hypothetical protein